MKNYTGYYCCISLCYNAAELCDEIKLLFKRVKVEWNLSKQCSRVNCSSADQQWCTMVVFSSSDEVYNVRCVSKS